MVAFYKTAGTIIQQMDALEPGSWVKLVNPTEEEIAKIVTSLGLEEDFVRAALDEEETSRVEIEDEQTLIIVDVPVAEQPQDGSYLYSTLPMGIILTKEYVVTVSLRENQVISDFAAGRVKNVQTALKTRFILQMLLKAANRYLFYLKQIDKMSSQIEKRLYKSLKNKELIQLLTLEKSLVYFTTSLKSTESTLEKLLRGRKIKLYEEDQELLEDVIIEFKQAIEMADIYASILSGTMDAFASVISNNLNIIMKILTVITILMTIPNVVFSFYGMNVHNLPLPTVWFPTLLAVVITGLTWLFLKIRKLY